MCFFWFSYGWFVSLFVFLLVDFVVCAVDWLDNLMATRPPQDQ